MATILEALKSINSYPIPNSTFVEVSVRRGIDLNGELSLDVTQSKEFNLCRADLLWWLSYAPNVTQGGQSYSLTDEQRTQLRNEAQQLFDEFEEEANTRTIYGYKGSRL